MPGQQEENYKEEPVSSNEQKKREEEIDIITSEKVLSEGAVAMRDIIAPSSMKIDSNVLELNGMLARTFFVVNYPRYINVGWFSPVVNLSATMDIAI